MSPAFSGVHTEVKQNRHMQRPLRGQSQRSVRITSNLFRHWIKSNGNKLVSNIACGSGQVKSGLTPQKLGWVLKKV